MAVSWRKSLPLLFLTILISTAVEIPNAANASSTTVLYVNPPSVADPNLTPGNETHPTTFDVNITVSDVEDLWGYQFKLSYNATLLTAAGFESYTPFTQKWGAELNDTEGYVSAIYSMPLGTKGGEGMYGTVPLAKITFTVDALGVSKLLFSGTKLTTPTDPAGMPHEVKDGFFANIDVHDVAITSFTASPSRVEPGDPVSIEINITNKGDFDELLTASVYYYNTTDTNATGTVLAEEKGILLGPGENTTIRFTWDTTGIANNEYVLSANATIAVDYFPLDNVYGDVRVRIGVTRDIAIINVTANPTDAGITEPVIIHVTVENRGNFTETFDVNVKANDTIINTKKIESLREGEHRMEGFTWKTDDVASGNYTITVEAIPSIADDHPENNVFTGLYVTVGMFGPPIILYLWVGTITTLIVGTSVVYTVRARSRSKKRKYIPRPI